MYLIFVDISADHFAIGAHVVACPTVRCSTVAFYSGNFTQPRRNAFYKIYIHS